MTKYLFATATPATSSTIVNRVGINMADYYGGDPAQPIANIVKYSDNGYSGYAGRYAWQTNRDQGPAYTGAPNTNFGADVTVDANGFPQTFVGQTVNGSLTYLAFTRRVLYGQAVQFIYIQGSMNAGQLTVTFPNPISQLVTPIVVGAILNGQFGNANVNITITSQVSATVFNTSSAITTGVLYWSITQPTPGTTNYYPPGRYAIAFTGKGTIAIGVYTYQATFTGSMASGASNATLTVSGVTGNIVAGMVVTGTGVPSNTTIVSGSGTTWTVSTNSTVASTSMTGTYTAGSADDSSNATSGLTGHGTQTSGVNYNTRTFTNTTTGTFYGVFTLTPANNGCAMSWIAPTIGGQAISSTALNYPTSVIVCLESDLNSQLAGTKFTADRFLNQLNIYSWVRFMTWVDINGAVARLVFTTNLGVGATSGLISTLNDKSGYNSVGWPFETKSWQCYFITGEIRTVTCTLNSPTITWSGGLKIPVLVNSWGGQMAYLPYIQSWADRPQLGDVSWCGGRGVAIEGCQKMVAELTAQNGVPVGYWHNNHPYVNFATVTAQTPFNGSITSSTLTLETTTTTGALRNGNLCTNPRNRSLVFTGYITNGILTIHAVTSGSLMVLYEDKGIDSSGTPITGTLGTAIQTFNLGLVTGNTWTTNLGATTQFGTVTTLATFVVNQVANGLALAGTGIENGTFIYSIQKGPASQYGYATGNVLTLTQVTKVTATIPATGGFSITPAVPNAGTWLLGNGTVQQNTLGVVQSSGNVTYTLVPSAPASKQYSVASGVYGFNAADAGQKLTITFEYTSSSLYGALSSGAYIQGLDAGVDKLSPATYVDKNAVVSGYVASGVLTIISTLYGAPAAIATNSALKGTDSSVGNPTSGNFINATLLTSSGGTWTLNVTGGQSDVGSATDLVTFTISQANYYLVPSQTYGSVSTAITINIGAVYSILPSKQPDTNTNSNATISLFQYVTPGCSITGTGTTASTVTTDYGSSPATFTVTPTYGTPTGTIPMVSTPLTAAFFLGYISSGILHVTTAQSGTPQVGAELIGLGVTPNASITGTSGANYTTNSANAGSSGSPIQMQAAPSLMTDGYGNYATQAAQLCWNNVQQVTGASTYIEFSNEVWNDTLPYGNVFARPSGQLMFPCYLTQSITSSEQEWFGTMNAKIADIFAAEINTLSGDPTGATFAQYFFPYMGSQYGSGGPVDQVNQALATPDWYPDGVNQSQAYTHNIRGICFAPYYDDGGTGSGPFVLSTPDLEHLLGVPDPVSEFFALMYSQTGLVSNNSPATVGYFYASSPTTTNSVTSAVYAGFVNFSTGNTLNTIQRYQGYASGATCTFSGNYCVFTNTFNAGNAVSYSASGTLPTNIVSKQTYFVSASGLSSTQFQLSSTYANAIAGTSLTLSGTGSGTITVSAANYQWYYAMNNGAGPILQTYEGGAGFAFHSQIAPPPAGFTNTQVQGLYNLVYAVINDQRMRYCVSDISGAHSPSGNGYLPGLKPFNVSVTMFTAISSFSEYGSWGATQSSMQVLTNLATAPGKYAGTVDFVVNR